MKPPALPPPPRRDPLELAIERRARTFDMPALLDLLRTEYPERRVVFRSFPSPAARPTLVEAISIRPDRITVVVNLGLTTASGPLPSYFVELFHDARAGGALAGLIESLDQSLLRARLATLQPEASTWLFGDVERTRRDLLAVARPATLGQLHTIFGGVFPELAVRVQRTALRQAVPVDRARLGSPVLGIAALGGETPAQVAGFDVVLRTGESRTWGDQPWGPEASRRIHAHVLPLLEESGVQLRVFLVDEEGAGELAVGGGSRLGLDPLGRSARPHVMLIFEGRAAPSGSSASAGDMEATVVSSLMG